MLQQQQQQQPQRQPLCSKEETERRLIEIARRCVVRDERKAIQNHQKLQEILQRVSPGKHYTLADLENAVMRQHVFIHEGWLTVLGNRNHGRNRRYSICSPCQRYFWLFNDCIIEARAHSTPVTSCIPSDGSTEGNNADAPKAESPKFELRHIFLAPVALVLVGDEIPNLVSSHVVQPESLTHQKESDIATFLIFTSEKRFLVRASNAAESEEWANAFRMVVGSGVLSSVDVVEARIDDEEEEEENEEDEEKKKMVMKGDEKEGDVER